MSGKLACVYLWLETPPATYVVDPRARYGMKPVPNSYGPGTISTYGARKNSTYGVRRVS